MVTIMSYIIIIMNCISQLIHKQNRSKSTQFNPAMRIISIEAISIEAVVPGTLEGIEVSEEAMVTITIGEITDNQAPMILRVNNAGAATARPRKTRPRRSRLNLKLIVM